MVSQPYFQAWDFALAEAWYTAELGTGFPFSVSIPVQIRLVKPSRLVVGSAEKALAVVMSSRSWPWLYDARRGVPA